MIFTYTKLSSAYAFLRTFQKWLSRRCQHTRKYTHWKWLCSPASRICGFCRVTSGVEQGQYIVYITIFSLNVPFSFLFPLWKEFSQRSRQAHPRQRNHEKGKKGKRPKTLPRQKGIDHQELQKALASPATKPYLIQSTISVWPRRSQPKCLTACNYNGMGWRTQALFSWWKNLNFDNVAHFVVT